MAGLHSKGLAVLDGYDRTVVRAFPLPSTLMATPTHEGQIGMPREHTGDATPQSGHSRARQRTLPKGPQTAGTRPCNP